MDMFKGSGFDGKGTSHDRVCVSMLATDDLHLREWSAQDWFQTFWRIRLLMDWNFSVRIRFGRGKCRGCTSYFGLKGSIMFWSSRCIHTPSTPVPRLGLDGNRILSLQWWFAIVRSCSKCFENGGFGHRMAPTSLLTLANVMHPGVFIAHVLWHVCSHSVKNLWNVWIAHDVDGMFGSCSLFLLKKWPHGWCFLGRSEEFFPPSQCHSPFLVVFVSHFQGKASQL